MADTKISALTAASAADGANELAINEAGASKKLTVAQVNTFVNGAVRVSTSDVLATSTTFNDITGLSFSLAANTNYILRAVIFWTSVSATTGINLAVTGPTSPTAVLVSVHYQVAFTGNTTDEYSFATAYDTGTACTKWTSGTQVAYMDVIIRNGSNTGNLQVRGATEVSSSQVTFKVDSFATLIRM